jgi:drug/metabolite transporter (DMT)-like permease
LLATCAGLVGAVGDVFVVRWTRNHSVASLFLGFGLWCLTLVALVLMLKVTGLGRAVLVFTTVQALVAIAFARLYFDETFSGLKILGAVLALTGVVLVEWSTK